MNKEEALHLLEGKSFSDKRRREYNSAIQALKNPGTKVRCGKRAYSGRYSTTISWLHDVKALFARLGFTNYVYGNDAPRGGRQGDYIIVH